MTTERLTIRGGDQSLAPLLEKTDAIQQQRGSIVCRDKLEVPLSEHGIPNRVALMKNVLNTVEIQHIWTGNYDSHHVAWPGADYKKIRGPDRELIGSNYRGCGSLKVRLPRQLHNYVHLITEPPPLPDVDVMQQYGLEHGQVDRLYDTIRISSYEGNNDLEILPFEEQERLRYDSYQSKLEIMAPGYVGVMPDPEYLAELTIQQARPVLRSIARVAGLSNARQSRKRFFSTLAA